MILLKPGQLLQLYSTDDSMLTDFSKKSYVRLSKYDNDFIIVLDIWMDVAPWLPVLTRYGKGFLYHIDGWHFSTEQGLYRRNLRYAR